MGSEQKASENGMNGLNWCGDPRHVRPSRRNFLYVGLIGGLGLSLGNYFQSLPAAEPSGADSAASATRALLFSDAPVLA